MLVESSVFGVLYAGKGEKLVLIVGSEQECTRLLKDPPSETFEAMGQAILVRAIDLAAG